MGFKPLEEIEGPIELTLRGKTYTLPTIMWEEGIKLREFAAALDFDGITKVLLGADKDSPHYDEDRNILAKMQAQGASNALIGRVSAVAYADWNLGREAAERTWEDPKALMTIVQAIQSTSAQLKAKATATHAAADATTPQPDAGNGTKTRTSPAKPKASRGRKSSPTGA